ncbi:hypothetical protein GOP47_0025196 [Adiantum capillus-veneris]|uniref:Pentatricopeptide repeat-containing protein n=1 Tax=Adiantum capillus-veneris TaxID=13818 RepID=A0A9D4Z5R5_ADICA|nr:hypothetical protein GOP47_0025196 [Adiantum capillus-veneris]
MGDTIKQLWSVVLVPSSPETPHLSSLWSWQACSPSQEFQNHMEFAPIISKESLWIDSSDCFPSVGTEAMAAENSMYLHTQDATCHQNHVNVFSPYIALLRTCAKNKDLHVGKRVHLDILKRGLLEKCSDALITMYAMCDALPKARELLDMHRSKNVFTWTSLISGYARNGQNLDALSCFEQMESEGLFPDAVTYVCILKACGNMRAIGKGEKIHRAIANRRLLGTDTVINAAIIDMYTKCGALERAEYVLEELPSRDVLSWSALIAGYVHHGQGNQALICFSRMQSEGFSPNAMTFACILKACGIIGALDKGKQIHEAIAKGRFLENDVVLGSALVDMYAKCGALERAKQVLEGLPARDAYSWSALIAGYTQEGRGEQALNCFEQMQREGVSPDAVTFACVLQACGITGAVDKGEQIHKVISKQGLLAHNVVLGTALVDMYAKCGALSKAAGVLEQLPTRDAFSWNSLIVGYAKEGQHEQALTCFDRMQWRGCSPDAATFSCVLNACSHLGLIDEAHMHFLSMSSKYGLKPDIEQYTCMVDLFGRAGHFEKALGMIEGMPSPNVSAVWRALLSACQKWGNVDVGSWAFRQAIKIDKSDVAAYVLMANIYSAAGMQEEAKLVESMQLESNACKKSQV